MNHPYMKLQTAPERPEEARVASQIVSSLQAQKVGCGPKREEALLKEYLAGNIPQFMRNLCPVPLTEGGRTLVLYCLPDYLCIGSDEDFMHTPMEPVTGQEVADAYGLVYGTPAMEDAARVACKQRVGFKAMTPKQGYPRNADMMHIRRWPVQQARFMKELLEKGYKLGELVVGHMKGLIVHPWIVEMGFSNCGVHGAYYGESVKPIHVFEEHPTAHILRYKDYSHGVLLWYPGVFSLNDGGNMLEEETIEEVLMGPNYSILSKDSYLSKGRFAARPRYPV